MYGILKDQDEVRGIYRSKIKPGISMVKLANTMFHHLNSHSRKKLLKFFKSQIDHRLEFRPRTQNSLYSRSLNSPQSAFQSNTSKTWMMSRNNQRVSGYSGVSISVLSYTCIGWNCYVQEECRLQRIAELPCCLLSKQAI